MTTFLLGIILAITMNTLTVIGPHKNVAYALRWPCIEEAFTAETEMCYLVRYKSGKIITGP